MGIEQLDRVYVTSSNLKSVGYDPSTKMLEIEFRDGALYRYDGVPPDVHCELMGAGSHGKYFHQHIRNVYSYCLID